MRSSTAPRISPLALLVDSDPEGRQMYAEWLRFSGFRVAEAATLKEALARVHIGRPHIITTGIGLLDGPTVALRPALRSTIDLMIRMRIAEIDYIKSIAPPPVAVPDSIDAHASGAPVAASWNTVMPDVAAMIGDEVQQLRGTAPVDAPTVLSFRTWQARDLATQMTIAAYWPPLPADG